jgi:hypothetical protein
MKNYEGRIKKSKVAEIWRGRKIRENPFFCPAYFAAILPWASHRVAVCRSDVRAVLESFVPFRGNSVIVNSPGHLISNLACRADLSRQSRFGDGGSRHGDGGSNHDKLS